VFSFVLIWNIIYLICVFVNFGGYIVNLGTLFGIFNWFYGYYQTRQGFL